MAQAPIMPVATDALIGDTTHLSAEQFGAYFLLLTATWRNNGQPFRDEDWRLSRICRITEQRWRTRVRPVIAEFFDIADGYWRQKRLEKEWNRVSTAIERQRDKGKQSASSKLRKSQDIDGATVDERLEPDGDLVATADQPDDCNHIHIHNQEEENAPNGASVGQIGLARGMVGTWEEVCGHIHRPAKLDRSRVSKLLARRKDTFHESDAEWRVYCERVSRSPLLSGQRGEWHATLDWVLEQKNVRKITEGNYDEKAADPAAQQATDQAQASEKWNHHLAFWAGFQHPELVQKHSEWAIALRSWAESRRGFWPAMKGPRPDEADCRAPPSMTAYAKANRASGAKQE